MIKRIRGGVPGGFSTARDNAKPTAPDDSQRLLIEQWKRSIINEKIAAKQHRVRDAASPVDPSSLEEITTISRIGRLRQLWRPGWPK